MNRYIFLLIPLFLLSFYDGDKLDFIQNNIPAAQDRASREGKLVVVTFGAKWCQPCIFMDENTWSNPAVIEYMEDHCIAAKVDVDDYKGQVFRDQYAVRYYPSVLIFNSKGDLLHKHEGLLGAESMVGLLQTYASKENESKVNASPIIAEKDRHRVEGPFAEPESQIAEKPHQLPPPFSEPEQLVPATNDPGYEEADGHVNTSPRALHKQNTIKRTPAKPGQSPAVAAPKQPKKSVKPPVASAPASPKLRKNSPQNGFTVQVGVYAAKASATKEAQKVGKKFGKTGSAIESYLKGKRVYRGVVGEFGNRTEASSFRQKVEKSGFKALVKAWADLK